jgi:hypothetical protein
MKTMNPQNYPSEPAERAEYGRVRRPEAMKASLLLTACALVFLGSIGSTLAMPAEPAGADKTQLPRITEVKSMQGKHPHRAGLAEEISVTVKGALKLRQEASATDPAKQIVLFFDGILLSDVHPSSNGLDAKGDGELRFFLAHSEEPIALWTRLGLVTE